MQKREEYASGVTNEYAEAKARIGASVVDGEYTVASEATIASFTGELPESGSMLVTLEVNGTVIAYRELYTFDSDEGYIQVGDYYIANESGSVTVETMEGGDVVRLKVEPIEIVVNDVFRAAVGEVAPKSEGGSGGGALIVTHTAGTLDKTWNEIVTAMSTTGAVLVFYVDGSIVDLKTFRTATVDEKNGEYVVSTGDESGTYIASSADGYPAKE